MIRTNYYPGGFDPAAPAQNRAEEWDSVAATYTAWDGGGVVTAGTPRALTAAEIAQFTAQITSVGQIGNQATVQQQVQAALAANRSDQTQDATIQAGATTIQGTAGTFTLAQCTTFIKQLAQAVNTLAGNDVNAKKELNALIRLALQQFDATN